MTTSFLWSFDCSDTSKALLLKENDSTKSNYPSKIVPGPSKMAYSLKEKKVVEKQLAIKRSLKSLRQSSTLNLDQKQNIKETPIPKKAAKTLQIIHEVSLGLQPQQKSIQIQTEPSLINPSRIRIASNASITLEQPPRSTQEMQPCGAQSVVWMRQVGLKRQISNQSTECKCQTSAMASIVLGKKENPESSSLHKQGRSVTSFFDLVEINTKPAYTSVVMPGDLKFNRIDEQNSDNSQSLKNVNIYSHRNAYNFVLPQQKVTQNSSVFAMNNSTVKTFKSKVLERKKFQEMEVRSAQSIKEEESVDQFSEVLSASHFSSQSKKFSLSGLILSKKLYHQD